MTPDAGLAPGTYTLIVGLDADAVVRFGAAGERDLPSGWYAYVGSAFGPGGLGRVERHRELARGDRDVRHWHVDYLLGHPAATVVEAVTTADADRECTIADTLADAPGVEAVEGLGASDCACRSHLLGTDRRDRLLDAVRAAHGDGDVSPAPGEGGPADRGDGNGNSDRDRDRDEELSS
jgi:endonuclease-3